MELGNSTRSLQKATYVPLKVEEGTGNGRALQKTNYLRSLALQEGDVNKIVSGQESVSSSCEECGKSITSPDAQKSVDLSSILRLFESKDIKSKDICSSFSEQLAVVAIPGSELLAFGEKLAEQRQTQAVNAITDDPGFARLNLLAQKTLAANAAFSSMLNSSQIGMLNLERLDMTPAGIEKGELIATVPLAPREKTSVTQVEWSTISSEFTSIVTDYLENYSQAGVEENTELAQATTSQNSHANQLSVTASVSGGIGFVTSSSTSSFDSQSQGSTSATDSSKHAQNMTRKASSRVIQSRKVTISTNSTGGSSVSASRTLENPSDTAPMRINYFTMMRKWHVGLYRYGLRFAYDVTIPEPGATLRQVYSDIEVAKTGLAKKFSFELDPSELTEASYIVKAAKYGVKSPAAPPQQVIPLQVAGIIPNLKGDNDTYWIQNEITFTVEQSYEVKHINVQLILSNWSPETEWNPAQLRVFRIVGCPVDPSVNGPGKDTHPSPVHLGTYLKGQSGTLKIVYFCQYFGSGAYEFTVHQVPKQTKMDEWRSALYQHLYNNALAEFTANQAQLQARLDELNARISGVDTLTLRREENDEVMKAVLRWIFPTGWQFMKPDVASAFANDTNSADEAPTAHGIHFLDNDAIPDGAWMTMQKYGREVSFLNQAIDWENVVYFLYSYFWDDPTRWEFIRNLQHPDPTRQAFLRAGSAKIVLTVRKGFETAFMWFVDQGTLDGMPDDISHYPDLKIAQEIQKYDTANYPGPVAANPTGTVKIGGQYASTMATSRAEPGYDVAISVEDATNFQVGNVVVIDKYESGVQERQEIVEVDLENNVLVIETLEREHGGEKKQYPVYQLGGQGLLISEWFEYTPSHETMIGINSDLDNMA